jgi:hypothetical protein
MKRLLLLPVIGGLLSLTACSKSTQPARDHPDTATRIIDAPQIISSISFTFQGKKYSLTDTPNYYFSGPSLEIIGDNHFSDYIFFAQVPIPTSSVPDTVRSPFTTAFFYVAGDFWYSDTIVCSLSIRNDTLSGTISGNFYNAWNYSGKAEAFISNVPQQ